MKYLFLSFVTLSTLAHAQTASTPTPTPVGYLKDFNYQVSSFKSIGQANALMNLLETDTRKTSICANRAHLWSFDLNRWKGVETGKVFIHFTALGEATENKDWAYHVAPYVVVNGQEMVLDAGFPGVFHGRASKMSEWTEYFGKSQNCVVLDPVNNPAHLALEQNNLPNDGVTPLTYRSGSSRQYPSTEGICYIRKVPMYYQWPVDVYANDLRLAGKEGYGAYDFKAFDQEGVMDACQQALSLGFRMSKPCAKYLGFKK